MKIQKMKASQRISACHIEAAYDEDTHDVNYIKMNEGNRNNIIM